MTSTDPFVDPAASSYLDEFEGWGECATCGSLTQEDGRVCAVCLGLAFAPAPPADDAVFVYGTLRPGCGNDRLWRDSATVAQAAVADGIRLHGLGRAFPYAVEAPLDVTFGTLLIFPEEERAALLQRFDWLEGTPSHYVRQTVEVATHEGRRSAWVYLAADEARASSLPPVPGNDWTNVR